MLLIITLLNFIFQQATNTWDVSWATFFNVNGHGYCFLPFPFPEIPKLNLSKKLFNLRPILPWSSNSLSENGSFQTIGDLYPLLTMNICLHILLSSSTPNNIFYNLMILIPAMRQSRESALAFWGLQSPPSPWDPHSGTSDHIWAVCQLSFSHGWHTLYGQAPSSCNREVGDTN